MSRKTLLSESQRNDIMNPWWKMGTEEIIHFSSLSEDDVLYVNRHRGDSNRMGIAIQLCYLRFPGRLWLSGEVVPKALLSSIGNQLAIHSESVSQYGQTRRSTRHKHIQELFKEYKFRLFSEKDLSEQENTFLDTVIQSSQGILVVQTVLEYLRQSNIVYSSISSIEDYCWSLREKASALLYERLNSMISEVGKARLNKLLEKQSDQLTWISWLKQRPKKAGPKGFMNLTSRLEYIKQFDLNVPDPIPIPRSRLLELARQVSRHQGSHLKGFGDKKLHASLIAFLIRSREELLDVCVEMHDRIIGKHFAKCGLKQDAELKRDRHELNNKVYLYATLGRKLIEARESSADAWNAIESVLDWDTFVATVDEAEKLVRPGDFDVLEELPSRYNQIRKYTPQLLSSLDFKGSSASQSLVEGINVIRKMNKEGKRKIPQDVPLGFIPPKWKKHILEEGNVNRQYYELCILDELRNKLRSGDIFLSESGKYRNFESFLLSSAEFMKLVEKGNLGLAVKTDFESYIIERKALLKLRLQTVNNKLLNDELSGVRLEAGEIVITPIESRVPGDAQIISNLLYSVVPMLRLTDLVIEVDGWTDFSNSFVHLHHGRSIKDKRLLFTCILADALNMNFTRMAQATPGVSLGKLLNVSRWYCREDTYSHALAEVVNMQHQQPLAANWGDGTTSSSDAQNFQLKDPRAKAGDVNPKYSWNGSVNYYSHITDRYGAAHIMVISSIIKDSPYVLDGLLYHETDTKIEEHYTDTGGFSDQVFGMCHLLGFRFAPRIRDLKDLKLYHCEESPDYLAFKSCLGDRINEERLKNNWNDILRVASSVKKGTVTASAMMRKLSAYPKQNSIAWALRELGRIERTLFLLDWFEDQELRYRVTRGLNKGESKHSLARDIHHSGLGKVQDHSYEKQMNRANGLNLITACIILWNTVYLTIALDYLKDIDKSYVIHVSPVGWEHINIGGDFSWDFKGNTEMENHRPLRKQEGYSY